MIHRGSLRYHKAPIQPIDIRAAGLIALLLAITLLLVSEPVSAQPLDPCANPRSAVESVFRWQQPEQRDLARAATCLEPAGRSPAELRELAERIKQIYDGRALFVNMDAISDNPAFVDPASQRAVVVPHPALPAVIVERRGNRWIWSAESLREVDDLYLRSYGGLREWLLAHLPASLKGKVFGVQVWQYLALLIVLMLGLVLRRIIQFLVRGRLRNLVSRHGETWASRVVDVFASPGATLIMAALLRLTYPRLGLSLGAALALSVAVRVMVVLSVVWAIYRLVDVLAEQMRHKAAATDSKLDDQLVPLVRKSLKALVVIAGFLLILQNMNVNVASLLAGLGIGGLAVALAAKDTIANFFGSVMIFVDRPFQIGDWVVIDGAEGIVEEVGFRSTRIRTFYNSLVTLPNARFMEAKIDNYGARQYRRTYVTLNLTYDTTPEQMQAFVEGVRAIIQANPHTRKDYYEVHMSGFGAHSLDVMLYFFFRVDSWSAELRERHNVFLEVMRLARDIGVQFAFPTRTLLLDQVAEPGRARHVPEPKPAEALAQVVRAFGPDGELARPGGPQITHGYFANAAGATAPGSKDAVGSS